MSMRGTSFFQQEELTSVRRMREAAQTADIKIHAGGPGSGPQGGAGGAGKGATPTKIDAAAAKWREANAKLLVDSPDDKRQLISEGKKLKA